MKFRIITLRREWAIETSGLFLIQFGFQSIRHFVCHKKPGFFTCFYHFWVLVDFEILHSTDLTCRPDCSQINFSKMKNETVYLIFPFFRQICLSMANVSFVCIVLSLRRSILCDTLQRVHTKANAGCQAIISGHLLTLIVSHNIKDVCVNFLSLSFFWIPLLFVCWYFSVFTLTSSPLFYKFVNFLLNCNDILRFCNQNHPNLRCVVGFVINFRVKKHCSNSVPI